MAERDAATAERDQAVAERDGLVTARDAAVAERDRVVAGRDELLAECDSAVAELDAAAAARGELEARVAADSRAEVEPLEAELSQARGASDGLDAQLEGARAKSEGLIRELREARAAAAQAEEETAAVEAELAEERAARKPCPRRSPSGRRRGCARREGRRQDTGDRGAALAARRLRGDLANLRKKAGAAEGLRAELDQARAEAKEQHDELLVLKALDRASAQAMTPHRAGQHPDRARSCASRGTRGREHPRQARGRGADAAGGAAVACPDARAHRPPRSPARRRSGRRVRVGAGRRAAPPGAGADARRARPARRGRLGRSRLARRDLQVRQRELHDPLEGGRGHRAAVDVAARVSTITATSRRGSFAGA